MKATIKPHDCEMISENYWTKIDKNTKNIRRNKKIEG